MVVTSSGPVAHHGTGKVWTPEAGRDKSLSPDRGVLISRIAPRQDLDLVNGCYGGARGRGYKKGDGGSCGLIVFSHTFLTRLARDALDELQLLCCRVVLFAPPERCEGWPLAWGRLMLCHLYHFSLFTYFSLRKQEKLYGQEQSISNPKRPARRLHIFVPSSTLVPSFSPGGAE